MKLFLRITDVPSATHRSLMQATDPGGALWPHVVYRSSKAAKAHGHQDVDLRIDREREDLHDQVHPTPRWVTDKLLDVLGFAKRFAKPNAEPEQVDKEQILLELRLVSHLAQGISLDHADGGAGAATRKACGDIASSIEKIKQLCS